MLAPLAVYAIVDGTYLPAVGWSTGWIGLIFLALLFVRGRVLTEKDHLERMAILQTAHDAAMVSKDAEIDRIEHDRQEWRTESRLQAAVISELNTQAEERNRQLAQVGGEVARTLDAVFNAIHPLPGGPQ